MKIIAWGTIKYRNQREKSIQKNKYALKNLKAVKILKHHTHDTYKKQKQSISSKRRGFDRLWQS